jgi:tRNA U34 5-methylaminomethyl-2-thiouridine-forming methyltransferase MnmC
MHGAISESEHVFIKEGFARLSKPKIKVLECGFGSGLNALLTLREAIARNIETDYHGIELNPISEEIWSALNYNQVGLVELKPFFQAMHEAPWEKPCQIHPLFRLSKHKANLLSTRLGLEFDLVYFDAFGPVTQPELWTKEIFEKIYNSMASGGVLTTYSCKGDVRRAMTAIGFNVEKPEGPPGKRSMLVGVKD